MNESEVNERETFTQLWIVIQTHFIGRYRTKDIPKRGVSVKKRIKKSLDNDFPKDGEALWACHGESFSPMLSSMGDTSIRKFQRDMRSGGNTREFMGDTGRSEGATGVDAGRVRMGSPGQIQRDPEEKEGDPREIREDPEGKSKGDTRRSGGDRGRVRMGSP
jgi:hypothetical protein